MEKEVGMLGRSWCVVRGLLVAIFLPVLLAATCAPGVEDARADAEFRRMVGPSLTDDLILLTDNKQYHRRGTIGFRVENRTDQTIWFVDQSFGIRGFHYNDSSQQWVDIDLGFHVSDPMPKGIGPGRGGPLDYYALWVDRIDVPDDGKIRLTITGHTDPEIPALDETYTAYTDIEVVE
jgi:hypothetical protein